MIFVRLLGWPVAGQLLGDWLILLQIITTLLPYNKNNTVTYFSQVIRQVLGLIFER